MMMKISLLLVLFVFAVCASLETEGRELKTSEKEKQLSSNRLGRKASVGLGDNYIDAKEVPSASNKEAKESNNGEDELKQHEDEDKNDSYDKYGPDDSSSESHHYYSSKHSGSGASGPDAHSNKSSRN